MTARTRSKRSPATAHHVGAILEEVRAQQAAMLEAISAWGERLERNFTAEFSRVNERLSNLEAAVLQNSRDIKKNSEDIKKNSEDIKKNSEDIKKNSDDIKKNSDDIKRNSEDIKKNSDDIRRLNAEVAELRAEVRQLRAEFDGRQEKAQIAALELRVTRLEERTKIG